MKFNLTYLKAWAVLKRKSLYKFFYPTWENYTSFAIICTSRTGSTWLHTLLNSHPNIISKGEIINFYHKKGLAPNLDELIFHLYPKPIQAVGLKVFYGDESTQYNKYLSELLSKQEVKIILLTRESKLAQYASLKQSEQNWEWSKTRTGKKEKKITLDVSAYNDFKDERIKANQEISKQFKSHAVLQINYEVLLEKHEQTLLEIQKFLDVTPKHLFSALERQSSGALQDRIENWTDFEELI